MKIAFIGSQGVGKTTLCYDLASFFKRKNLSIGIVAELSREAVKRGFLINQDTTINSQVWILMNQISQEIESGNEFESIVCDRSVIDNYIYLLNKFGSQKPYETLVLEWIKTYDFLFKVPVIEKPEHDGVRSTDLNFQKEIDKKLTEFLKKNNIKVHELSKNRDNWIKEIVSVIKI